MPLFSVPKKKRGGVCCLGFVCLFFFLAEKDWQGMGFCVVLVGFLLFVCLGFF